METLSDYTLAKANNSRKDQGKFYLFYSVFYVIRYVNSLLLVVFMNGTNH